MIDLNEIDKIYLYPGTVDLRKGMNTLGYMASQIKTLMHASHGYIYCYEINNYKIRNHYLLLCNHIYK